HPGRRFRAARHAAWRRRGRQEPLRSRRRHQEVTRRRTVRNSILASLVAVLALLLVAHVADPAAQGRQRVSGEGFISEGIPKMPTPPGPAPKRDMSGAWVGPGTTNKPDPVPPMTPAGERAFKERKGYGAASGNFGGRGQTAEPGESNDPFIT